MMTKVIEINSEEIIFDDGSKLYSDHWQDCCESHYLDFSGLTIADFEGLEFDLSGDNFFERVEDYGIRLKPVSGHPISIAGYGANNGYYSSNLTLVIEKEKEKRNFDISDCQVIRD